MLVQLLVGSLLICASIIVEVCFIGAATVALTSKGKWLVTGNKVLKLMISLLAIVLWMLAAISIAAWIWAAAFLYLGQFDTLETSVYFSIVSMTTLGYGDLVLAMEWRLLSGLIAANGLILFSLTTAFLIEFIVKLRDAQEDKL